MTKLLVSLCKGVEKYCKSFIWGSNKEVRKNHLLASDEPKGTKDNGDLNSINIITFKEAFITKLGWINVISNLEPFWVKCLEPIINWDLSLYPRV